MFEAKADIIAAQIRQLVVLDEAEQVIQGLGAVHLEVAVEPGHAFNAGVVDGLGVPLKVVLAEVAVAGVRLVIIAGDVAHGGTFLLEDDIIPGDAETGIGGQGAPGATDMEAAGRSMGRLIGAVVRAGEAFPDRFHAHQNGGTDEESLGEDVQAAALCNFDQGLLADGVIGAGGQLHHPAVEGRGEFITLLVGAGGDEVEVLNQGVLMADGSLNVGDDCAGGVICVGISGVGHLTEGVEQVIFEIREFHLEGAVSHVKHYHLSSLTFYIYYITKIFSCQVGAGVLLIRFRAGAYTSPLYYTTKINLCQIGQEAKDSCGGWGRGLEDPVQRGLDFCSFAANRGLEMIWDRDAEMRGIGLKIGAGIERFKRGFTRADVGRGQVQSGDFGNRGKVAVWALNERKIAVWQTNKNRAAPAGAARLVNGQYAQTFGGMFVHIAFVQFDEFRCPRLADRTRRNRHNPVPGGLTGSSRWPCRSRDRTGHRWGTRA